MRLWLRVIRKVLQNIRIVHRFDGRVRRVRMHRRRVMEATMAVVRVRRVRQRVVRGLRSQYVLCCL